MSNDITDTNQFLVGEDFHDLMNQKLGEVTSNINKQKNDILIKALNANSIDERTLKNGRFKSLVLENYADGSSCYFYDNGTNEGQKIVTFTPLSSANLSYSDPLVTQNISFSYLIHEND